MSLFIIITAAVVDACWIYSNKLCDGLHTLLSMYVPKLDRKSKQHFEYVVWGRFHQTS
jgi:hypothetical protein